MRVRGVQHHGSQADDAIARQRTAINLAGVKTDEVERGMELASPGYLLPTRRILVELKHLSSSPLLLKDRQVFNLHLGTREVLARINLKGMPLPSGECGFAELRTKEPIVAAHGQRFILRAFRPASRSPAVECSIPVCRLVSGSRISCRSARSGRRPMTLRGCRR